MYAQRVTQGESYQNYDESSQSDESDTDSDGLGSKRRNKKEPRQQIKKSVRILLTAVLETIREGGFNAVSSADRHSLAEAIDATGHPTALHVLAEMQKAELPNNSKHLQSLVKSLAKPGKKRLLAETDYSERTPLHIAISNGKRSMVKWMCEAYDNIDAILSIQSGKRGNCIHYAIESASERSNVSAFLVNLASEATLSAKNDDGNTPLHLAVAYRRVQSLPTQLELIMAIVKKCDKYTKSLEGGDLNRNKKSPYIHYLETRNEEIKKAADERKSLTGVNHHGEQTILNPTVAPDIGAPEKNEHPFGIPQRRVTGNFDGDVFSKDLKVHGKNTLPKNITAQSKVTVLPSPETGPPSSIGTLTRGGNYQGIIAEAMASSTDKQMLPSNEDEVGSFLKLHYLRTRDHSAALEILYGGSITSEKDKDIFFDVSEHSTLTLNKIQKIISHLKFENILQFVHIPKVSSDEAQESTSVANTKRTRGRDGNGRNELEKVFGWLRDKGKGVTTILRVTVDDLDVPAHSDVAIEAALKGMGVEVWDWKKYDLSSEVIRKVSPDVREVHLHWSGQNSVLRGWSAEQGLPQLRGLRKIVLNTQQQGILDPQSRVDENVEEFKARIDKNTAMVWSHGKIEECLDKSREELKAVIKELIPVFRALHVEERNEEGAGKTSVICQSCAKQISRETKSLIDIKLPSRVKKEILKVLNKGNLDISKGTTKARVREMIKSLAETIARDSEKSIRETAKNIASLIAQQVAQEIARGYKGVEINVPKSRKVQNVLLSRLASAPEIAEQPEKHRWIETMTDFRTLLVNAEKKWGQDGSPRGLTPLRKSKEAIEVAVIDDGADTAELQLGPMVDITGHSFCHDNREAPSPWYTSSGGHGTIMASQVHRICPMAKLYILKLEDSIDPDLPTKRRITIESATKAIRQAVTMKVHIISMSWTIQSAIDRNRDQGAIAELEAAIREAATNKILMFCSASDEGVGENLLSYPYKASSDIIKIGAADVNGKLFDKVGDTSTVSFLLPGKEVEGEGLSDAVVSKIQYLTGSSVSTALAAGLAALILYCAQARYLLASDDMKEKAKRDYELLKTHDKMREAFREIGTTDTSGQKYIKVWEVFGRKFDEWKDLEGRGLVGVRGRTPISIVASVADTLCVKF